MQLSYGLEHAAAILGMLADSSNKFTDGTKTAAESIPVGRGLMRVPNSSAQVRLPGKNYATLTASADLIADNSTIITVNAVATTATVYATSHAATMAAIVAKVAALSTVANAWLDASNNRIIHIIALAKTNTSSGATTGGGSQPTWTAAASFRAEDFFGIAQLTDKIEGQLPNTDNTAAYALYAMVNSLRQGRIWVNFETAFDPDVDTLYVRVADGTGTYAGDFRNDADSGDAVSLAALPIKVETHLAATGMGVIEINMP